MRKNLYKTSAVNVAWKIYKGLGKLCNGDRVRGIEAFARKGATATSNTYYRAP